MMPPEEVPQQDDPLARLKARKAAQQGPPSDDPLARLKARKEDPHVRAAAIAKRMEGANRRDRINQRDLERVPQSPREAFGGMMGSMISQVPFGKAFTAMAHSAIHGQPYGESYRDVESAIDRTPAAARIPASLAGAVMSTAALPGASTAAKMGQYGVLHSVLSGDPEKNLEDRGNSGIAKGVAGYGLGKAGSVIGSIGKAALGPNKVSNMARALKQPAADLKNAFQRGRVGQFDTVSPAPPMRPQGPKLPPTPTPKGLTMDERLNSRLNQWGDEARNVVHPQPEPPAVLPEVPPAPSTQPTAPRRWWPLRGQSRPVSPRSISPAPKPAPRPMESAPSTAKPGHPIWQGGGSPTRTAPPSLDQKLKELLAIARQNAGDEVGNVVGDAELATKPHASDDLEDLLRRSLRPKP